MIDLRNFSIKTRKLIQKISRTKISQILFGSGWDDPP